MAWYCDMPLPHTTLPVHDRGMVLRHAHATHHTSRASPSTHATNPSRIQLLADSSLWLVIFQSMPLSPTLIKTCSRCQDIAPRALHTSVHTWNSSYSQWVLAMPNPPWSSRGAPASEEQLNWERTCNGTSPCTWGAVRKGCSCMAGRPFHSPQGPARAQRTPAHPKHAHCMWGAGDLEHSYTETSACT